MNINTLKKYFEKQLQRKKNVLVSDSTAANDPEFETVLLDDKLLFFFERNPKSFISSIKIGRVLESQLNILAESVKSGDYPSELSSYPHLTLR